MHSPEKSTDAILRRCLKTVVPQKHFPIQGLSFTPERRAEQPPVRVVTGRNESLKMMSRVELVKNCSVGEMRIISAQAHQLFFLCHVRCRIRNENGLAPEEERCNALALGTHHLHSPVFTGKLRNCHPVMLIEKCFQIGRASCRERV